MRVKNDSGSWTRKEANNQNKKLKPLQTQQKHNASQKLLTSSKNCVLGSFLLELHKIVHTHHFIYLHSFPWEIVDGSDPHLASDKIKAHECASPRTKLQSMGRCLSADPNHWAHQLFLAVAAECMWEDFLTVTAILFF